MGEARYYAILVFPSEADAKAALPKVKKFLKRVHECYDDWQENRESGAVQSLAKKYSDVFHHLNIQMPSDGDDGLFAANFLAGELESPAGSEDYEIYQTGNKIKFAGTVWHLGSWNKMVDAMKAFGAIRGGWESDEYVDVYDAIEPVPL